ncbi:MAG: cysteine hydrolase [Caldilineaceae bacterium]
MATHFFATTHNQTISLAAQPAPFTFDRATSAVLVVDMQNDFGAEGGMLDRLGIDISMIQNAVDPIANVLRVARETGIKVVYLKMGFCPDLADLGAVDSPNRVRHLFAGVGESMRAPDGTQSRVLIRDTWNTAILPQLAPQSDDVVIYKHRYSGFYETALDATLKRMGINTLIVTGCTTSVCVESTVRDAMFRDYHCLLLADCMGEPIGDGLSRSNHDASLLVVQLQFGWVAESMALINALHEQPATVAQAL